MTQPLIEDPWAIPESRVIRSTPHAAQSVDCWSRAYARSRPGPRTSPEQLKQPVGLDDLHNPAFK